MKKGVSTIKYLESLVEEVETQGLGSEKATTDFLISTLLAP